MDENALDTLNTLYHGDSLRLLPRIADESVDAVVTDPPYAPSIASLAVLRNDMPRYPRMAGDEKDNRILFMWMRIWLMECFRIVKSDGALLLFSDWRHIPLFGDLVQLTGWRWRNLVVWNKGPDARPMPGTFRYSAEFILFATKSGWRPQKHVNLQGILSHKNNSREKNHMTAKPVELIKDLMAVLPPGVSVLDPFMGGGAVPRACVETGRTYCGIEVSKEYFDIASEFVLNGHRVRPLREKAAPRAAGRLF
jgi:site-specific DNA-methyltransferase (adenine-specific)